MKIDKFEKERAAVEVARKRWKAAEQVVRDYEAKEMLVERVYSMAAHVVYMKHVRYIDKLNAPWTHKKLKPGQVFERYHILQNYHSGDATGISVHWTVQGLTTNFKSQATAEKAAKKLLARPKSCDAFKTELAALVKKYQK